MVVAGAGDVWPAPCGQSQYGPSHALGHQTHQQRWPAPACRRYRAAKVLGVTLPVDEVERRPRQRLRGWRLERVLDRVNGNGRVTGKTNAGSRRTTMVSGCVTPVGLRGEAKPVQ